MNKLEKTLLFVSKLIIFTIPLYVIISLKLRIVELQFLVANAVKSLLTLSNIPVIQQGLNLIINTSDSFTVVVNWDCVGWKSLLFYIGLIIATPSKNKQKLYGLLILPIIFIFNIIRIWLLVLLTTATSVDLFYTMHIVAWNIGSIIIIITFWYLWIYFIVQGKTSIIKRYIRRK